jgi:UDP:flavonoid glycosyltransferase YjiC (YdhE family)
MTARHIVFSTVGSQGDLFPLLAVGRELRRRGHQVTVAAHLIHQQAVEDAGLTFLLASGIGEPADKAAFAARAFHPLKGPRFVVHDLAAADVAASYAALAPACRDADAIVTTTLAFAAQIIAAQGRMAWLSAVFAPSVFLSAYDPPATGLAVLDRLLRGSHARASLLRRGAERITRQWTAPVRAFRRSLGLPEQGPGGDPLHAGQHGRDGVLALYSPLLGALPPDAPAGTIVTGACRYVPHEQRLPADLQRFLDEGEPPVVFTLGSAAVHAGEPFLRHSMHAAARLGVRAVLLTGSPELRQRLGALPPAFHAVDYAAHGPLFEQARAVVHHGGIGTTQEALRAGRPQLVVPHGFDQPDNAQRMRRLGVACVLPAWRYRAHRAATALAVVCGHEAMRDHACAMADAMRAEHGPAMAADVIERAMAGRAR